MRKLIFIAVAAAAAMAACQRDEPLKTAAPAAATDTAAVFGILIDTAWLDPIEVSF